MGNKIGKYVLLGLFLVLSLPLQSAFASRGARVFPETKSTTSGGSILIEGTWHTNCAATVDVTFTVTDPNGNTYTYSQAGLSSSGLSLPPHYTNSIDVATYPGAFSGASTTTPGKYYVTFAISPSTCGEAKTTFTVT